MIIIIIIIILVVFTTLHLWSCCYRIPSTSPSAPCTHRASRTDWGARLDAASRTSAHDLSLEMFPVVN